MSIFNYSLLTDGLIKHRSINISIQLSDRCINTYENLSYRSRLLVTELCNGTLHDLVVNNKSLLLVDVTREFILHQIVEGLAYLHDIKKMVHRDLKPRNILYSLSAQGVLLVKLADFGCSRKLPEGKSHYSLSKTKDNSGYTAFRPFGTDGWLPHEVLNGSEHYTYKGDIIPLGFIFCFVLCNGLHPFGEDSSTRNERIRNNEQMLPDIQQMLKKRGDGSYELIVWMLNPNPGERPTAVEVLQHKFFIGIKKKIEHLIVPVVDELPVSLAERKAKVKNILFCIHFLLNIIKNNRKL